MHEDLRHLALLPEPAEYAALADLRVPFEDRVLPLHSSALAMHSNVLRAMFRSAVNDKAQWAAGVAAAFHEWDFDSVCLFLCLNYPTDCAHGSHGDVARARAAVAPNDTLQGVVRLADKLDCPMILAACESFLLGNKALITDSASWLAISSACGLAELRQACAADVLHALLATDSPGSAAAPVSGAPGALRLEFDREDLRLLLRGTLQAWHAMRRRHVAVDVKPVEVWAHVQPALGQALERRRKPGTQVTEDWLKAVLKESIQPFKVYSGIGSAFSVSRGEATALLE